jgi:hypothetical protein
MLQSILPAINKSFALAATEVDLIDLLAQKINYLIINDFDKLISILYRADVDEKKLNAVLQNNKNETAGKLIAHIYITRQLEIMQSRANIKFDIDDDFEEERW